MPDEEMPLLRLESVSASYGSAQALFNVSLSLQAGTSVALLGPNGAGKSTLGRCMSGLVPLKSGSIHLGGIDITNMAPHRIRRLGLSYLPEGRGIFPGLSVVENLRMSVRWMKERPARVEALDRVLEMFPILAKRQSQKASSLSGGEQQMLSVAGGLAMSPRVLIADELSLGLAPMVVDALFEGLAKAREAKTTIVLIEQYVHRALSFSDRCVILRRGSACWEGEAAAAQEDVLARYLGDSVEEVLL
jgi:branched-chain amino acid transport system ATP-binding protein